jgi:tetratricopeptide (TPR) repeat protein
MTDAGGATNKRETEIRHLITQDTRFQIIQNILAHPETLPSLRELEYVTDKGKTTIHEHIETLEEAGVVERHKLENANVDDPSTFFGLTPYGLSVVDQLDLFNDLGLIREMYSSMDKPQGVKDSEDAPRPEKATLEELREELAEKLDNTVESDGSVDTATEREIAGLSYALDQAEGSNAVASAATELGQRLLEALKEPTVDENILTGLQEIGSVAPTVISPAVPHLIDRLDDTSGEYQSRVLQILATIANTDQTSFATDVREQLASLDISSIIDDLSPSEAQDVVFGLEELYADIDATESRAEALKSLGNYASDSDAHEIAIDAYQGAADLFERLERPSERAGILAALGNSRYAADKDSHIGPIERAGQLYLQEEKFDLATRTYGYVAIFHALNGDVNAASEALTQFEPFEDGIEDTEIQAVVRAAKGLVAARKGHIEAAADALRDVSEVNDDTRDILGGVQLMAAQEAINNGYQGLAYQLASDTIDIYSAENNEGLAFAHQLRARAALMIGNQKESKEQYKEAIELFSSLENSESTADCLQELASLNILAEDLDAAERNLLDSLDLLGTSSSRLKLRSHLKLADIYTMQENIEALTQRTKTIENILETNDIDSDEFGGEIESRWAELALIKEDLETAIDRMKTSINRHAENGEHQLEAHQCVRLASLLENEEQYEQSEQYLDRAVELSNEEHWPTFLMASSEKARFHRNCGNLEAALETLQHILEVRSDLPDESLPLARVRIEKGEILKTMERFEDARSALTTALSALRDVDAHYAIVKVLRMLVEIATETENTEQAILWCESAESYIHDADEEFSDETELYFIQTRAELQSAATGAPDLLYVGLQYLQLDKVEQALQPLRQAWQARDRLDPDDSAYAATLSAGVGFVGATQLVSLDEARDAGAEVLDELESYTDALGKPAMYLYQFLTESTDTYSNLELEAAERLKGDHTRLERLEAIVFRDLVKQLRADDDDFQTNPTQPLKTTLEDDPSSVAETVAQQQATSVIGRTASKPTSGRRTAD